VRMSGSKLHAAFQINAECLHRWCLLDFANTRDASQYLFSNPLPLGHHRRHAINERSDVSCKFRLTLSFQLLGHRPPAA
jgi:hypothetical protein